MVAVAVVFMWIVFVVFKLLKSRKLVASAISLILTIPISLGIDIILSRIIHEPIFDVWDAMTYAIIAVVAGLLFYLDYAKRKRAHRG
jgi:hypothetical protein